MTSRLFHESIPENTMSMLIMGKGPSARHVAHLDNGLIGIGKNIYKKPSRLEITTINDAWQIVDQVDYAFMIDYMSMQLFAKPEIKSDALQRIKRLVLPTYPQVYKDIHGITVRNSVFPMHPNYHVYTDEYQSLIEGIPYYMFQLDGSVIGYYGVDALAERPAGTAFAAVTFAIARGFRHFVLCGFDPLKSQDGFYNSNFVHAMQVDNDVTAYYVFMYMKLIEKILASGCTYETLSIPEEIV